MKARWKSRKIPITAAFALSLLFGGRVEPEELNPNKPSDVENFDIDSLGLLVEEGRRQLDNQTDRFRHTTDRAQLLLTVSFIAVGFIVSILDHILDASRTAAVIALVVWSLGLAAAVVGLVVAASAVVVRADFKSIDTTNMTTWKAPIIEQLASHLANAVMLGETTVAARVTVFRQATRWVVWGALLGSASFLIST